MWNATPHMLLKYVIRAKISKKNIAGIWSRTLNEYEPSTYFTNIFRSFVEHPQNPQNKIKSKLVFMNYSAF